MVLLIVDETGKDRTMRKEQDQAEASEPKLAADKQTAGWPVHQTNGATSYSRRLPVYRAQNRRTFGDGLMIYDWCFGKEGAEVAFSTGQFLGCSNPGICCSTMPAPADNSRNGTGSSMGVLGLGQRFEELTGETGQPPYQAVPFLFASLATPPSPLVN